MEELKTKYHFNFIAKRKLFGILSFILVTLSLVLLFVPGPNYGIDFKGGTNLILRFNEDVGDGAVREAMSEIGFENVAVQRFGDPSDNQFLIQTEAVTSITPQQLDEIETAAKAELGEDLELDSDDSSGDRIYIQVPIQAYAELEGGAGITEEDITRFSGLAPLMSERIVTILDEAGLDSPSCERFGNPLERNFLVRVQALQTTVDSGMRESFAGQFDTIDRIETVGPRVGEQLRNDGVKSLLLALVGILLYIAIRFDFRYAPGAVVALAHDILITLGIFVIMGMEINLPIVAALLTIVGYSLNDTIVNFDRIRENLQLAGGDTKNLLQLVNRSLNECLSRTILTSLTTLLAVISILILGGGLIRAFAIAMTIGVIVGTYSSIYIAAPIMISATRYIEKRPKRQVVVRETSAAK